MMNFVWKRTKNKKGFTLIELVVVIAIIGILAVIAIPKLSGFTNVAKEKADMATAATIGHAAQAWVAEDFDGRQNTDPSLTTDLEGKLLPAGTKAPQSVTGDWSIDVTDGDVTVTAGGTTFYPVPES